MSEKLKHWAESLQVGDRCLATIRHKTEGTKNIHEANVITIENHISKSEIQAWFNNEKMLIPYNELTQIESPEAGHQTHISEFLQTVDLITDYAISDKEKVKMIEEEVKKEYQRINQQ